MEADMADELGEADVSSEETPEASPRDGNEPPTPTMCTKDRVLPAAGGDHSRLRTLVCSAVRTFLSEELETAEGFSIDGMIGVTTLEQGAMFYVTLSETVPAGEESYTRARRAQRKRKHSVESEGPGDDKEQGQPCASPDPLSRASSSSSPSEVVVKQEAEDSSGDAPWYPPQGGTSEARYTPDADDSLPAFPDFSRDHHAYQGVDPGSQWTYPPHHTDPTTASDTVDYRNIPPDLMSPESVSGVQLTGEGTQRLRIIGELTCTPKATNKRKILGDLRATPDTKANKKKDQDPKDTPGKSGEPWVRECSTAIERQTRWCVNKFKDWLEENALSRHFERVSVSELDEFLGRFYVYLSSPDATLLKDKTYRPSTLNIYRSCLNRHLISPPYNRNLSLMKDEDFVESNKKLCTSVEELRRNVVDEVVHYKPIRPEDIKLLYERLFSIQNPWGLLYKVFFELAMYFGQKNSDMLRHIQRENFSFSVDERGKKLVTLSSDHKLNVQGQHEVQKVVLYENAGSDECPVHSLELYLAKLNPLCPGFFQYPRKKWRGDVLCWYSVVPLGKSRLKNLMKTISAKAELSMEYANGNIYQTGAAMLGMRMDVKEDSTGE